MKFVSIPYNDFIYEIFIYEMLCEIFVRGMSQKKVLQFDSEIVMTSKQAKLLKRNNLHQIEEGLT
jgi:hypothetical protein